MDALVFRADVDIPGGLRVYVRRIEGLFEQLHEFKLDADAVVDGQLLDAANGFQVLHFDNFWMSSTFKGISTSSLGSDPATGRALVLQHPERVLELVRDSGLLELLLQIRVQVRCQPVDQPQRLAVAVNGDVFRRGRRRGGEAAGRTAVARDPLSSSLSSLSSSLPSRHPGTIRLHGSRQPSAKVL